MDIRTVLDLDRLRQALNQSPELTLNIILRFPSVGIEHGVERHLGGEVIFLEVVRFLLELLERIHAALFEAKFAGTDQAFRAMPVILRDRGQGWIETRFVVPMITTIAHENRRAFLRLATDLAFLAAVSTEIIQ